AGCEIPLGNAPSQPGPGQKSAQKGKLDGASSQQPAPRSPAGTLLFFHWSVRHGSLHDHNRPDGLRPSCPSPSLRGNTRMAASLMTQCFSHVPQPVQESECTVGMMRCLPFI